MVDVVISPFEPAIPDHDRSQDTHSRRVDQVDPMQKEVASQNLGEDREDELNQKHGDDSLSSSEHTTPTGVKSSGSIFKKALRFLVKFEIRIPSVYN